MGLNITLFLKKSFWNILSGYDDMVFIDAAMARKNGGRGLVQRRKREKGMDLRKSKSLLERRRSAYAGTTHDQRANVHPQVHFGLG